MFKLCATDRKILQLAIPTLGALAAHPLFLLADTAIIGQIDSVALAGLGLATIILTTIISASIFLSYGTTALVARYLGQKNLPKAISYGIDSIWLAFLIGLILALILPWLHPTLLLWLNPDNPVVNQQALSYLNIAVLGIPAILMSMSATGLVRGLQDAKTPLKVAIAGALLNIVLNLIFVYGFGLAIAGAAIGTVIVEWLMIAFLLRIIMPHVKQHKISLRPNLSGIGLASKDGLPLFLRTISLRVAILMTTYVITQMGTTTLAAHQVVSTIWVFLTFVLDSFAIAGQSLIGKHLGAKDKSHVQQILRRLVVLCIYSSLFIALFLIVFSQYIPKFFSNDLAVREQITLALWVLALAQPLSAYAYTLDGVLIGAGDGVALAKMGLIALIGYAPILWLAYYLANLDIYNQKFELIYIWVAYAFGYMGMRAITLYARNRSGKWMNIHS